MKVKTQKELNDEKKYIINKIGFCNSIKRLYPEYFQFFNQLLERHPKYSQMINEIYDISIKQNPVYKNKDIYIRRTNNEEDELISLKNCIVGKETNLKQSISYAMRIAIEPQIKEYALNNDLVCSICNSRNNPEIDHYEPQFKELMNNFLYMYDMNEIPRRFGRDKGHRKVFLSSDYKFKKEWCNYHLRNATLRVLCKTCNQ